MENSLSALKSGERAELSLRALYGKYGYTQFKMSKFEEYDFYAKNKDFLVSENVITFTDTDGRLLALKPDVTLSIIKNGGVIDGIKKVYYAENVYRVGKGVKSFKEIKQVGLECLGCIDDYCLSEVLILASKSLSEISDSSVLDISHLGITKGILEKANLSAEGVKEVLSCIENKNRFGIAAVCDRENVSEVDKKLLKSLVTVYGDIEKVLPQLDAFVCDGTKAAVNQLKDVCSALISAGVKNARVDFSVINDMNYYNGIVFKGFIDGIPSGVLSGGQYDNLMRKMKRNDGAIGFAVYLDALTKLDEKSETPFVDVLIVYDKGVKAEKINAVVRPFIESGLSVAVQPTVPDKMSYGKSVTVCKEDYND